VGKDKTQKVRLYFEQIVVGAWETSNKPYFIYINFIDITKKTVFLRHKSL
jgi:hypothetical protein